MRHLFSRLSHLSRFSHLSVLLIAALLGVSIACVAPAKASDDSLAARLHASAPELDPQVLQLALEAWQCALADGMPAVERLAVIDYSLPSTEPRLWVFDLDEARLLFHEHVAHGSNSGDNLSTSFSNKPDSHQSSLGLFRTADTYQGRNGYSLHMDGLEPGFNDKARERAIVIHGASYVDNDMIHKSGRLGRSWGCPAVRLGIARPMIDALKGGQLLFAYYPDLKWLNASHYLHCPTLVASR
ncbi:MAG: murein L,D-transpeptidase catalytic domain family protein [Pseudomonadales bacterium]|jgi:hypothetical protein|nr:murein L,D-transpeptidase catalytic domain family protein [Pseudomonadales bacterium]